MYEKLVQCPGCGHDSFHNHIICKDYTVTQQDFAIVQCDKCSLQFTNPRPDLANLDQYYQSDNYISHSDVAKSIVDIAYKFVRRFALRQKLKIAHKYSSNKTLLDYGCGTGYFLKEADKKNWTVAGIEPNEKACDIANNQLNGIVKERLDLLPKDTKYSVITLWHVLEHISNLNDTIKEILGLLDKNGHLIVAVPNPNSYDAQKYKQFWAAYDVPRHLYHFTPGAFSVLMKKHGLKIVDTLPMKFDAYYVSLLSEKYKTGTNRYLKSIITGYKSNVYASKNKNMYSSLIYILTKK
jgi:2-polyprenyl-3-methyl-5-hydroxy-6-metoxy-1,4-benzoquinol methylase